MNKKLRYMMLCLSLFAFGCNDWLDVQPKSQVKEEDLFSSESGFRDALTGIYALMGRVETYGGNSTMGFMDMLAQTYSKVDYDYEDALKYNYKEEHVKGIVDTMWSSNYNAIANCNYLLQNIEKKGSVMSERLRNVVEGEALALRAFLHFDLLRLFGKSYVSGADEKAIPYVKAISKKVTPLSTVSEVLDLVTEDLERAAALLEEDPVKTGQATTSFLGTRSFHFNYYAVRALLARVYLYKNDKVNALKNAQEVILSGKYTWVNKGVVATTDRKNRDGIFLSECIWTLNNTKLKTLTETYLKESDHTLYCDGDVIDEIFESNSYGGLDWRYIYYFERPDWYWLSSKLYQVSSAYNNRQPLLRLSEMYLIAAECAPSRKEAVEYFNTLRRHRGFEEAHNLKEDVTDENLQTAIGKEYRKEFIGEGQWFFYCKRTDQAVLPNVTVPFSKAYYVLPIPDQEKEYGNRN